MPKRILLGGGRRIKTMVPPFFDLESPREGKYVHRVNVHGREY
jgi:hypothetical protein